MSQDNNDSANKNFKNQVKAMKDLMQKELSKKHFYVLSEKPNVFNNNYQFIPIPPATVSNRKAELLPLYKNGERSIKFLKK